MASRPFPYGPSAYVPHMQEATRVTGGCLSLSHSLSLTFYLFPCPVLSTCEYVSSISYLTDTCLVRSNGRTLVGALEIQILSACSLLYIRLSLYALLSTVIDQHADLARCLAHPEPEGLETRRLRFQYQII